MKNNMKPWLLVALFALVSIATIEAAASSSATSHEMNLKVREVAMVSSSGPDTLVLSVDGDLDGSLRLQYTAVNSPGAHRTILVSLRPGNRAPTGTSLRMRAINVLAGCGFAGSEVVLSDRPSSIISGIPSCATGRGSAGALVEYRLSIDDASRLVKGEAISVTLVFTISEDS